MSLFLHLNVEGGTPRPSAPRSRPSQLQDVMLEVRSFLSLFSVPSDTHFLIEVLNKTSKKKLSAIKITITTTLRESLGMFLCCWHRPYFGLMALFIQLMPQRSPTLS
jgi:hypothetical protein